MVGKEYFGRPCRLLKYTSRQCERAVTSDENSDHGEVGKGRFYLISRERQAGKL